MMFALRQGIDHSLCIPFTRTGLSIATGNESWERQQGQSQPCDGWTAA